MDEDKKPKVSGADSAAGSGKARHDSPERDVPEPDILWLTGPEAQVRQSKFWNDSDQPLLGGPVDEEVLREDAESGSKERAARLAARSRSASASPSGKKERLRTPEVDVHCHVFADLVPRVPWDAAVSVNDFGILEIHLGKHCLDDVAIQSWCGWAITALPRLGVASRAGEKSRHPRVPLFLDFCDNLIGDAGLASIVELLVAKLRNVRVRSLRLHRNKLGPAGAAAVARLMLALGGRHRDARAVPEDIHLCGNNLGDEGVQEILGAAARAGHKIGSPAYPIRTGKHAMRPLWLRVENNGQRDRTPAELVDLGLRLAEIRRACGFLESSSVPMLCTAQQGSGCCASRCAQQETEGPIVHMSSKSYTCGTSPKPRSDVSATQADTLPESETEDRPCSTRHSEVLRSCDGAPSRAAKARHAEDWRCSWCDISNFKDRTYCRECGESRPGPARSEDMGPEAMKASVDAEVQKVLAERQVGSGADISTEFVKDPSANVVLCAANVCTGYARRVLGEDFWSFSWEGLRRTREYYQRRGITVYAVVTSHAAHKYGVPIDLEDNVITAPKLGDRNGAAVLMMLRLAMTLGCQFIDSGKCFAEWTNVLPDVREWVSVNFDRLHVDYTFDRGLFVPLQIPRYTNHKLSKNRK